ncbi:SRP72 [Auxenochlorella protothecoides x Auxenochlorella symbiontica]
MPESQPSSQMSVLINRLDTHLKSGRHKKALKTAEEVLNVDPSDEDVRRCKVVLLLELNRFADALAAISAHGLDKELAFERAYCQYREGKLEDALVTLQMVSKDRQEAKLQLEAQLRYRLGQYPEAIAIYRQLFQQYKAETMEVQTNVLAAYVAGGQAAEVPAVLEAMKASPKDSFEVAFNSACALLETGELEAAQERLLLAQRVGEETLIEEGLEEEELAKELVPITAQLAYVAHRRGAAGEAEALYHQTMACCSGDAATEAVVACNLAGLALLKGERRGAGEALRRLESAALERVGGFLRLRTSVEGRLSPAQRAAVLACAASVAVGATRLEVARELLRTLGSSAGAGAAPRALPLLQASLAAAEGRPRDAAAALGALGEGDAAATALRAQLAAAAGDAEGALGALRALPPDVRHRRGVLATALELARRGADGGGGGGALLEAARSHWTEGPGARDPGALASLAWVLARLAGAAQERGEPELALGHWAALEGLDSALWADPGTQRQVAWTVALADPSRLPADLGRLAQAMPRLAPGEEESAAGASLAAAAAPRKGAADEEEGAAVERKRRARKKRVRLPKGFDPEHPGPMPDPERWLPKWQRAEARKGRKKRRDKNAVKGSQGAGKVDETLDRAAVPAPAEASKGPPPKPPAGGKKKGKGRR